MAIYIKQINKRRHLEKTLLAEALDRGAQRLGFLRKKSAIPQTSQSALRQLLDALGIKDYDRYLTQIYGDYMKIPKGDQQRQHNFHILDLEHPYREYKGEA